MACKCGFDADGMDVSEKINVKITCGVGYNDKVRCSGQELGRDMAGT